VRATILAVGFCATALVTLAAMLLFIGTLYAHEEVIGVLLTAGAIAGPLFGTIAGSHQERWNPLIAGCAIGVFLLFVLFSVPLANTSVAALVEFARVGLAEAVL
jgi:hypothetical protein